MRLFSAVLPSQEAVAEVARTARDLRDLPGAERLRWRERSGWHVTLAFYGERGPAALPELYGRLAGVAREREPFTLRLAGGGTFGDRTLWVGVAGQTVALAGLASAAGPGVGEHDLYRPHLTLGSGRTRLDPFTEALSGFAGTEWAVGRLVLMRSEGGPGGRYVEQASWGLGVR
ncbi:RNA 2',3'-cyclic phosphodiesterase [Streptomyces sp. SBT349]|uniref:RNA 2',3'-cyclic phosphodiesterase n=1 Tax=Streptomyces sp. SBT349 TaxID=1580539 RepID=UPI00066D3D85|nr:RNA 2',3'-cyclic phosphodiesterase [Streptomyces sp. SBT349]